MQSQTLYLFLSNVLKIAPIVPDAHFGLDTLRLWNKILYIAEICLALVLQCALGHCDLVAYELTYIMIKYDPFSFHKNAKDSMCFYSQ